MQAAKFVRLTVYGLLLVLAVGLVSLGGFYIWLRTALPERSFTIARTLSHKPIVVMRDDAGLPTIEAASEADAVYALGFVHAQDRMFQMDLMRRYGAGRLSEWFGRATLASDRFMRTLGLNHLVEQQYRNLSQPLQQMLQSYADGVNAYSAGERALSPEYYLLGTRFEPWRPQDCLIWAKLIDLDLTGNFKDELLHAQLLRKFSPHDLGILFPAYPATAPLVVEETRAELDALPLKEIYASLPSTVGALEASNNWVISGRRTSSGKPLLANDPHLRFAIPSIWYLARLKTSSEVLTGASAPGTPFILIGHNSRIAWGITATRSDVADIFIEKIDSADPARYETPTGPKPFTIRQETIGIKGEVPVTISVRETRHGPVISDLAGFARHIPASGYVLALQATWLTSDDTSPEAAWGLTHAHGWEEFRNALKKLGAPQQNFVYADVEGNIGFMAPATVPVRRRGDGWLPVPGWDGEHDWSDKVPFESLPWSFNPPSGAIASANNKLGDRPFLARDWIPPYRAERIHQLLGRSNSFSADDMVTMQFDTVSLAARQLLPLLSRGKFQDSAVREFAERLQSWDGRMVSDRSEPLLFSGWLKELTRALLLPRLGELFPEYGGFHPDIVYLIMTQHPQWCDDPATIEIETCDDQIARSFERAVTQFRVRSGGAVTPAQWGSAHKAVYSHPVWSKMPIVADFLTYRIPADGSTDTIDNAMASFANDRTPFQSYFGSTLRMVVDLADLDQTRFMIVPGQSGNPISQHYGDRVSDWRQHKWLRFQKP